MLSNPPIPYDLYFGVPISHLLTVGVVGALNQENDLLGAFSVITNLRMDLFQALHLGRHHPRGLRGLGRAVEDGRAEAERVPRPRREEALVVGEAAGDLLVGVHTAPVHAALGAFNLRSFEFFYFLRLEFIRRLQNYLTLNCFTDTNGLIDLLLTLVDVRFESVKSTFCCHEER